MLSSGLKKNDMYTPKYGEIYYYITGPCKVTYYIWKDKELDWEYRNVGNCFQTKEEAEIAAERVKKTLKGILKNYERNR